MKHSGGLPKSLAPSAVEVVDPVERLAWLTPRGVQIGHIPGGVRVSSLEVLAGALGLMHDQTGADMLAAKYMLDAGALRMLRARWKCVVMDRAAEQGWHRQPKYQRGTTERLALITLAEWWGADRCFTCKGSGLQPNGVPGCVACEGLGLRRRTMRADARALGGYTAEGYRTSQWPVRMQWARHELRTRELEALDAFEDALRPGRIRAAAHA